MIYLSEEFCNQSGQTAISRKVAKSGKTFPYLQRFNLMKHCIIIKSDILNIWIFFNHNMKSDFIHILSSNIMLDQWKMISICLTMWFFFQK